MHRLLIAAAAAAVLSMGAAAHAGGYGEYSGGSYAPTCGCQGYDARSSGDYGYGAQAPYVDEDDGYYARSYGYRSDDYVPFESSTYGYSYEDVYGRGDYSYEGRDDRYDRDDEASRYRSYSYDYDDSRRRRTPRTYSYRTYHYSAPHYARPAYRYRPRDGHSSTDGERG